MPRLPSPWWFHSSSTRISSLHNLYLAIWDVRVYIVGPISPPSSKRHWFILAITDYFYKWAEAIPLREVKTSDVIKFVKHHVIYRFGVPRWIVHDNGGPNSSVWLFRGSATSSESRVCPQRHTTQLLTALRKLSIRLLTSFSRNSSQKANVIGTTN